VRKTGGNFVRDRGVALETDIFQKVNGDIIPIAVFPPSQSLDREEYNGISDS